MSRGTIFWVIMLLLLLFGFLGVFMGPGEFSWKTGGVSLGMTLVELVLFGLLGWQVFGPAIKG